MFGDGLDGLYGRYGLYGPYGLNGRYGLDGHFVDVDEWGGGLVMSDFRVNIAGLEIECRFVDDGGIGWWLERLSGYRGVGVEEIGFSREGRPVYGILVEAVGRAAGGDGDAGVTNGDEDTRVTGADGNAVAAGGDLDAGTVGGGGDAGAVGGNGDAGTVGGGGDAGAVGGNGDVGVAGGDGDAVAVGGDVVTITAGAHADEPAGPLAAMVIAEVLARGGFPEGLGRSCKFLICPQVNPDGAQANCGWFAPVADLETYLRLVKREGPGDDIEFGYPGDGRGALRPENQAVADFLSGHAAAGAHFSLHSMAFASGAWYLLNGQASRDRDVRRALVRSAGSHGFKLHDIQRNGEKGFTRLGSGLCTTPNSRAMRAHFENLDDPEMAAKFHLSSMEWAEARNPGVYCMVTELPVFSLEDGYGTAADPKGVAGDEDVDGAAPRPGSTAFERFREGIKPLVGMGDFAGALALAESYKVKPVPFKAQVETMVDGVFQTLLHRKN